MTIETSGKSIRLTPTALAAILLAITSGGGFVGSGVATAKQTEAAVRMEQIAQEQGDLERRMRVLEADIPEIKAGVRLLLSAHDLRGKDGAAR